MKISYSQLKNMIKKEREKQNYYIACGFYPLFSFKERIKAQVNFIKRNS